MAGLVPAVHDLEPPSIEDVDARLKAGHDGAGVIMGRPSGVMAGLVPAIHDLEPQPADDADARLKAGHDGAVAKAPGRRKPRPGSCRQCFVSSALPFTAICFTRWAA